MSVNLTNEVCVALCELCLEVSFVGIVSEGTHCAKVGKGCFFLLSVGWGTVRG